MHSYIAIQNTYEIFEMALFINNTLHDTIHEDKRHTSKLFIPLLDQLLTRNNIDFTSLSFCAVNCGPGPFSTLRSIIASVNGLHCATNIPLIGIDGLDALFLEFYNPTYQHTIVLLNAFNNEVYYLIADGDQIISKGYKKIDAFLEHIKHQAYTRLTSPARPECPPKLYAKEDVSKDSDGGTYSAPVNFIGNGVALHHDLIKNVLGDNAVIADPIPAFCSLETIAHMGLQAFKANSYTDGYLMPLHLKKHAVEL
jgi:tRNA threonylcarbamoyladenosine biosynthesis protein TsaB